MYFYYLSLFFKNIFPLKLNIIIGGKKTICTRRFFHVCLTNINEKIIENNNK